MYYILDEHHKPIETDTDSWADWMDPKERRRLVAADFLHQGTPDEIHVSTVFLGIDHGYGEHHVPVLFETMVFGLEGEIPGELQRRYTNWDDAVAGHNETLIAVKDHEGID